jgi:hypothetical protein
MIIQKQGATFYSRARESLQLFPLSIYSGAFERTECLCRAIWCFTIMDGPTSSLVAARFVRVPHSINALAETFSLRVAAAAERERRSY